MMYNINMHMSTTNHHRMPHSILLLLPRHLDSERTWSKIKNESKVESSDRLTMIYFNINNENSKEMSRLWSFVSHSDLKTIHVTSLYDANCSSKSRLYFLSFCRKVVKLLALFLLIALRPSRSSQH